MTTAVLTVFGFRAISMSSGQAYADCASSIRGHNYCTQASTRAMKFSNPRPRGRR